MTNKDTYKRFTELKTYNNGKKMYVQYSVSGCYNDMNRKGDYTTGDSVDRLAELEDKIEDGTLVFIDEPFYSKCNNSWAVVQRTGDNVITCYMTEDQAKDYKKIERTNGTI